MRKHIRGIDHAVILVHDLDRAEDTYTRLGFTLTPRGNGWAAVATSGTLWTELSIDCPFSPCRATVTERGVGIGSIRR